MDQFRIKNREELEEHEKKLEEGDEKEKNLPFGEKFAFQMKYFFDNGTFLLLPTPYSSDNNFFFQQTECKYTEGKVFDKTFFPSRREGEESMVLTMTPGMKRSDII
ncbi:6289_t:CDS:2 [Funneliformis geosporum]|uniref:6289_t:CDS:1 n=1 Tax=Funneliformis geosporum TaxID=1117311 RepID=A0A9W4X0S0_9GLOM|nr:6289_t:CDS:2 [Funneliformis geosporum]